MRKQSGITLIALIITIIVMMILVGVTVTVALNGGLFDVASKAARETTMAQIKERAEAIRYTLLAEIRTGNNLGNGIIEVYKGRLQQEFGEENVVIIGNKIIIDGKYEIVIKNTNLDIDIGVNKNNNSLVVGITTTSENSDVDENGNIHAIMMKFNLSTNVPSEKYEDYKNNITIDDKRDIVLSEYFEWYAQEFETLYEVICYEFGVERMEDYIYENEGIENATLGQIYYYYINLNCEGEYTEEEFIDKLKSEGILNVDVDSYYNKKTKNLKAIMVANGKETVLGTNYSVDSKPVVEFLVYENGVYDLKIVDNYEEIVAYEKVIVNNIVENEVGYYVPANGPWKTNKEGRIIGYTGTETEITIPTYVGTEKITSLGDYEINNERCSN